MNTKELMIGNWVFVDKIGKPAIIREVYANGVMTNIANNVLAKEISPLPLTKEILEYNGFKAKLGAGGLFQITVSGVCCEVDFNIIHYVHELQQALLICGVNKEIKIEGVETTNDKDLLITDLSGRIPFGVIAEVYDNDNERMVIPIRGIEIEAFRKGFCDIKPYLRSMDSMTDEEAKELTAADRTKYPNFDDPSACEDFRKSWGIWAQYCTVPIDWLHKHHFDYRGLIKRGLAIKVTDNNNPYIKKESEM